MKKTTVICTVLVILISILSSCVPKPPAVTDASESVTKSDETTAADIITEEDTEDFEPEITPDSMPYYNTVTRYAWSTLSHSERQLYYEVLNAALCRKEYVDLPDDKTAKYIFECVIYDTPELFYISETPSVKNGRLSFGYVFGENEAKQLSDQLDGAYLEFFRTEITDEMTEYEKLQSLYEYIINRTKYNSEASAEYKRNRFSDVVNRSISAIGPLLDGSSICVGYARATQYLALRLGIQTFTVKGAGTEGEDHYFCLVLLDDGYYYVDTTWGDPSDADKSVNHLTYNYFCITTEELLRSHLIYTEIPLPKCTSMKYNYFVYNGLVAETVEEALKIALKEYLAGKKELRVKTSPDKLDDIYSGIRATLKDFFAENGITGITFATGKSSGPSAIFIRTKES